MSLRQVQCDWAEQELDILSFPTTDDNAITDVMRGLNYLAGEGKKLNKFYFNRVNLTAWKAVAFMVIDELDDYELVGSDLLDHLDAAVTKINLLNKSAFCEALGVFKAIRFKLN